MKAIALEIARCERGAFPKNTHPAMTQTPIPPITPTQTGAEALTAVNAAVSAAIGLSASDTEPSDTLPGMLWLDTSTGDQALYQRSLDDTGWIMLWQFSDEHPNGPDLHRPVYLDEADYDFSATAAFDWTRYASQFYCTTGAADRTLTLQAAADRVGRTLRIFRAEYDDPAYTLTVDVAGGDPISGIGLDTFTLEPNESVLLLGYDDELVVAGPAYRVLSHSRGGFTRRLAATATLTPYDRLALCDATAGTMSVNLQPAAECAGLELVVVKTDAGGNAVTVDPDSAETINGSATAALSSQYDTIRLVSTGTEWITL